MTSRATPRLNSAHHNESFAYFCLFSCRLFSSAVFNDQFDQHTAPEILNTALEGVILVMKAMGIDKVSSINFV